MVGRAFVYSPSSPRPRVRLPPSVDKPLLCHRPPKTQRLPPDALGGALRGTYTTLRGLEAAEAAGGGNGSGAVEAAPEAAAVVDWKGSIRKNEIRCLECGESFKQLSLRHLATHGLDPRSYRAKFNIPPSQSLSSRAVSAKRREAAQRTQPWELSPSKTQADTATANGTAKVNGTAKPAAKTPAKAAAKPAAKVPAKAATGKAAAGGSRAKRAPARG